MSYIKAQVEIFEFETEDVILTSGENPTQPSLPDPIPLDGQGEPDDPGLGSDD